MTDRAASDELAALKVGDMLYSFDTNRRTYRPNPPGQSYSSGGPIYERHFEAEKIVGETKLSWVMERGAKINKKTFSTPTSYGFSGYFTKSAMDSDIWKHSHRHKIVREVERASADQLRAIAQIVGYVTDDVGHQQPQETEHG